MLQLSDRDISIHQCKFQAYIDKVNVNIKFPCSFFIQWNSINGKYNVQTQSHIKTKSNFVLFEQKIYFNAELIFDKKKKKFIKKQSIINLSLTSKNRPDQVKLVGRVTIDLSQIINNSKYSQIELHKLSYCSVQSEISLSIKFLKSQCLNKSISDLDKSSFHDLYSFKVPLPNSNTLNTTKQTKQQTTKDHIYVQQQQQSTHQNINTIKSNNKNEVKNNNNQQNNKNKNDKIIPDNIIQDEHNYNSKQKDKKSYRTNENIILINERKMLVNKSIDQKVISPIKYRQQQYSKQNSNSKQRSKQKISTPKQGPYQKPNSKASSINNLPIDQKNYEQTTKLLQQQNKINKTPLSQTVFIDNQNNKQINQNNKQINENIKQITNKIIKYQQEIKNLKNKLINNQKQLNQKSNLIVNLQQKIKYYQKIIKDSKSNQDQLQNQKKLTLKLKSQNQKLQLQNQKLQSIQLDIKKINSFNKQQLQKINTQKINLEKKIKQLNFSLNSQIVQYKQKIQNLQLKIKQKQMEINYSNKKASLIQQNLNHFRLLSTNQLNNNNNNNNHNDKFYQQQQYHQSNNFNQDSQSLKKIKSLQNRVDSLLELNKRQTQQINQKNKLIDQINSKSTYTNIQLEQKNKSLQQLKIQIQQKRTDNQKLKCQIQLQLLNQKSIKDIPPIQSKSIQTFTLQKQQHGKQQPKLQTQNQQSIKASETLIATYKKSEIKLKQKIIDLQDRIRQLQSQIIKCRDPSCLVQSQGSKMTPAGDTNLLLKSQYGQNLDKQLIKSQQTISYLAKQKQILLIQKSNITQNCRIMQEKLNKAEIQINRLNEQLKKYTQIEQNNKNNPILSESIQNLRNKNQHSLSAQNITPIKNSQQGLNQTVSKLSQLQKSMNELNIDPQIITLDPVKAILLAQLSLLKTQNAKISQQLRQLKISVKQPIASKNNDQLQSQIKIPQLTNFSQQLKQQSIRQFGRKQSLSNNLIQSPRKKSQQQINEQSIRVQNQFIQSIQDIDSSKKSKLLLETRKLQSPQKTQKQPVEMQMTLLDNNSGPQLDNIRFSQTGANLKGTRVPMLKKNTQSVWDMQSNFSARNMDIDSKQKSIKSIVSKHTQFMDDNQFRIMSIDDQAQIQQLRIIVRQQQTKIKIQSEMILSFQKKFKQIETEKLKIQQDYNTLFKQHQQSTHELQKIWKEKQDLIFQLMFGKQSSIAKPHEQFGIKKDVPLLQEDQPISISIKQSAKPTDGARQSSRVRPDINRGRMFLQNPALTQINEQASFLEDTMLRLSNLEQTFRYSEQTGNGQSSANKQLDVFRSEIGNIKQSFMLLEQDNNKLHKQISGLRQIIQQRQKQRVVNNEEIKSSNVLIQRLRSELKQKQQKVIQVNRIRQQIQAIKNNQIKQVKLLLSQKDKQIQQSHQKIQQLNKTIQQLNKTIQQSKHKIQQLNQIIKESNQKIQQLQMNVQISKINQKQPILQNNHIQSIQNNYIHNHLYLDLYSNIYHIKIQSINQTLHNHIHKSSHFRISSAVKQLIQSNKNQQQIINNNSNTPSTPKTITKRFSQINNKKPIPYPRQQESQSISQIKVPSIASSKKSRSQQKLTPIIQIQKPIIQNQKPIIQIQTVNKQQNDQHESSVYYSIDDQYQQSLKDQIQNTQVNQMSQQIRRDVIEHSSQKQIPSLNQHMKKQKVPIPTNIATQFPHFSDQQFESLQKKVQQLYTQLRQREDYIVSLQQQIKSNMNLRNQVQQLKQINLQINDRNKQKQKLVQQLQDRIHALMKQLQSEGKNNNIKFNQDQMQRLSIYPKQNISGRQININNSKLSKIMCSQCSANILQLQSMRKQLTSINLQLNSNRQQKLQISQQLSIMKSENQNLKNNVSKLYQEYTVIQNKLEQANNQIDRVKSELAIRTINQSRDNQKDLSKDGKDLPRQSSHSHELLIISKGIQDQNEQPERYKNEILNKKQTCKQTPPQITNQKPKQLFYSLKVKQQYNKKASIQQPFLQQLQGQDDKQSISNNSVKMNKKISQVNIRYTQAQKKSNSSKPQKKQYPNNIDTVKHWNSCEQKPQKLHHISQRISNNKIQNQPQLHLSSFQKARSTYQNKLKQINHQNQQLRDQLIQMNHQLMTIKKQHIKIIKQFDLLKQQNLSMKKQIHQLIQGKTQLQTQVQHLKLHTQTQNQIRILHVDNNQQIDAIMHPQSSQGGEIRQTAKFNPFDDLSPAQRQKLQHDLQAMGYKTQLKVDWPGINKKQKIRNTDRSDRSKTSDFKQIISLGGDNAITPINYSSQHDITINNGTNDISTGDINQSRADLYQDIFFKDQQIQELKIDIQTYKQKVIRLQQLCDQLRQQNENLLQQKDKQIDSLSKLINEMSVQKSQIQQLFKKKSQQFINTSQLLKHKQSQLINTSQLLKKKCQQCFSISELLRQKSQQLSNLQSKQTILLKKQTTNIDDKNNNLKEQQLIKSIKLLQTNIKQKQVTIKQKQVTIKQRQQVIKQKQGLIRQKQGLIRQKQGLINKKQLQIRQKQSIIKQMRQQIQKLNKIISNKDQQIKYNNQQINNIKHNNEINIKNKQITNNNNNKQLNNNCILQIKSIKQSNLALTKQLNNKISTIISQQKLIKQLQSSLQQMKTNLKSLQTNKLKLQKILQNKQQKNKELTRDNELIKKQFEHITKVNQKAIQKISILQNAYKDNFIQFKKIQQNYQQVINQFQSLKQQNQKLKQQYQQIQSQYQKIKLQYQTIKQHNIQLIKENTQFKQKYYIINNKHIQQQVSHITKQSVQHTNSNEQVNNVRQINKLRQQIQTLKKNQLQYMRQIERIRIQGKQIKRQISLSSGIQQLNSSGLSSSILLITQTNNNNELQNSNIKRQGILKLLNSISKTFKLLSIKNNRNNNNINNNQNNININNNNHNSNHNNYNNNNNHNINNNNKQIGCHNNINDNRQQQLFKMINNLAIRNQFLQHQLSIINSNNNANNNNIIINNKQNNTKTSVLNNTNKSNNINSTKNNIKPNNHNINHNNSNNYSNNSNNNNLQRSNNNNITTIISNQQLGKQLYKKITELKLNIIKNISTISQLSKQSIIKQLNNINQLIEIIINNYK